MTNHDVKAVEYWIKSKFEARPELQSASEFVHFACTSEDINNLAYALTIRQAVNAVWLPAFDALLQTLTERATTARSDAMLAHTHGQPATPTTVGKEFAVFVHRLRRIRSQIVSTEYLGKFSGATGTFAAHVVADPSLDWQQLAREFVESLGLDESEIFNAYNEVKSIREKDEFLLPFIGQIMDPHFHTGTAENDQTLLKSLIVFACLMEGLFFYVGFTQILALGRQNKMTGAAEQYQYILRDESMHCNFGIDLINTLKLENPHLWTAQFKGEIVALFHAAVELEYRYAEDTMPRGVLGMNASMFKGYLRYIANRRAVQIGLEELFPNEENPFPWMSEMIDLKKERNFFETRVIEYQSGGALSWD